MHLTIIKIHVQHLQDERKEKGSIPEEVQNNPWFILSWFSCDKATKLAAQQSVMYQLKL